MVPRFCPMEIELISGFNSIPFKCKISAIANCSQCSEGGAFSEKASLSSCENSRGREALNHPPLSLSHSLTPGNICRSS